jgi:hypothetical protein
MTDLLEKAPQPFIRMSGASSCRLKIANSMIGTPERARRTSTIPMMMGTYLEPMVVQWLANERFTMYFTGDDQLEVVCTEPTMIGHPDGIIGLNVEPSYWAMHNLPERALHIMATEGRPMLLEIKTMNEDSFANFLEGGIMAGAFTRLYEGQNQSYLNTIQTDEFDEAWADRWETIHEVMDRLEVEELNESAYEESRRWINGSDSFKEMLEQEEWVRPSEILLVAFAPASKEFAFEVIDGDHEFFMRRRIELQEGVIDPLRNGTLPDPDHDGSAAECYFCAFAYCCPAVTAIMESRAMDTIPVEVYNEAEQLDELATEYHTISREWKALDDQRTKIRKRFGDKVPGGSRLVTPNFLINMSSVKGRRSVDLDAICDMLHINKSQLPYKEGKPYTRLSVEPLYGPSAEGER